MRVSETLNLNIPDDELNVDRLEQLWMTPVCEKENIAGPKCLASIGSRAPLFDKGEPEI